MPLTQTLQDRRRSDRLALEFEGRSVTYAELADRSARVATILTGISGRAIRRLARRLDGQVVVAILLQNRLEYAELFAGASAGSATIAILDGAWAPEVLADVLRKLEPDLCVVDLAYSSLFKEAAPTGLRSVVVDGDPRGDYEALLRDQVAGKLNLAADDSPMLVGFTSGTTGLPKPFLMNRAAWRRSLVAGRDHFRLGEHTRTYAPGPLRHGFTLYAMIESMHCGGTFMGASRFGAPQATAHLLGFRPDRLVVVPAMLSALSTESADNSYPWVQTVVTGAASLSHSTVENYRLLFPSARMINYYGASELGFVSVANDVDSDGGSGVGHTFIDVDVRIAQLSGAKPGVGEVMVRSPYLSEGYLWGSPKSGFRREGEWATVGDVGFVDPAGRLHLIGRIGNMINVGGLNVFPDEVERAIGEMFGTDRLTVVPRPHHQLGETVALIVETTGLPGLPPSYAEFVKRARDRLPPYKIPLACFSTSELPATTTGKIDRREAARWLNSDDSRLSQVFGAE